jgi:hypothetical protein
MNKKAFKQKLKGLKLNQKKFAELTEYSYSAVKGWEETPKWVEFVLSYFEILDNVEEMGVVANNIQSFIEKVQNLDLIKRR